ncbi:hypothetical protein LJ739_04370 [Aestuariibacter halophilus]|uniref:Membrane-associated protein n=1 Tax=Fluctibacter halophilus TaxID=226011 RepID=A0ABS8G4Q9_9ALTE|nr:hypothetical protein [Aestuariibacter halophilus]MCC2615473.1 hypothetical protein [Aestuariibacter halophilus]
MHLKSLLPASALLVASAFYFATQSGALAPGDVLLEQLQHYLNDAFVPVLFLIILLESIMYVGFYFPGQFFAVLLVIAVSPTFEGVLGLTVAMVAAATVGSAINFYLGRVCARPQQRHQQWRLKQLLPAMIHMNGLAFYMFSQGANGAPWRIVWLAGLFNLPYYLLLVSVTVMFSNDIMGMAEDPRIILVLLATWLIIASWLDIKRWRQQRQS